MSEIKNIPLDFKRNDNTQTVSELWLSIQKNADRRVSDNELSGEYPLDIRDRQLAQLKVLVSELELAHTEAKKL